MTFRKRLTATREFVEAILDYSQKNEIAPSCLIVQKVRLMPAALSRARNGKPVFEPERKKFKSLAKKIGYQGEIFRPLN